MGTREPRFGGQCEVKHVSTGDEVACSSRSSKHGLQRGRAGQQSLLLLLPQELRVEIFSRLDAHSVIRLQSVCRDLRDVTRLLRSFPVSDRVITSKDQHAFAPVAFLVAKGQKWIWAGYDPAAKLWKWLPSFSALLVATDHPDTVLAASDGLLCASSNGLICALVRGTIFPVTVCNPLTREHRRLPPLTKPRCPDLLHILRDQKSNRYRIIASGGYSLIAGEYTIIRKTECYDSSTNSWTETSKVPQGLRLQRYQNGVYSNGFLYCLARGPQLDNLLLAYHLESGTWVTNLTCEFLRNQDAWGGPMNAQFVTYHTTIYYYEEFQIQGTRLKGFTIDELDTIATVNPNGTLTPMPAWNNPDPSPDQERFFSTMLSDCRKQGKLRRLLVEHRPLCQSRGTAVAQGANQVCVYYPKEAKGMVYHFPSKLANVQPPRRERLPDMNPASSQYLNADMMELPESHLQPLPWPFELSFSATV
ncbi:hypothetical protein KC19_5G173100 [Ceratodon purpureus]|uniref:F-box domain-containing protein n=1 Tax=Ceratodon purpureus TaxID=3225 RepID=A0A8T0I434_CERPU|nr:hypothetical protein KC19_5G173100 [Ceratodon purpureus]